MDGGVGLVVVRIVLRAHQQWHHHADADRVIVEETMTATLANGNRYTNDYCLVFELRNGLIRRVREYLDTARGRGMISEAPRLASR